MPRFGVAHFSISFNYAFHGDSKFALSEDDGLNSLNMGYDVAFVVRYSESENLTVIDSSLVRILFPFL
jgi:hypothetical protein